MRPRAAAAPAPRGWPDPIPTAAAGAFLLALLSPVWPGLGAAVVPLAALAGAALLVRAAGLRAARRRALLAAVRLPVAGYAVAWALVGLAPALPPVGRALPLAAATLWLARSAGSGTEVGGP